MQLKIDQLKEFQAKAAMIPSNNLLPILGYLKFEPGKVTKNSMQSFITMDIECTETFLIDEKQLMSFVGYTKAPAITLSIGKKTIDISDGSKIKYSSPTEDASLFPANDIPVGDPIPLSQDFLDKLATASAFNVEDLTNEIRSHVFVGNGLVSGSDSGIAFIEGDEAGLEFALAKQVAANIGKLTDVVFTQNESYHFFTSGKCRYGFAKPTCAMVNFNPFVVNDLSAHPNFTAVKSYLIALNDLAMTRNPLAFTLGRMRTSGGVLTIDFKNEAYGLDMSDELDAPGADTEWFGFNAALMNRLLKSIPGEVVTFTSMGAKMYVTCPGRKYTSLMMRIAV